MVVTSGKGCSDQFEAEVSVLPSVHHRNHVILHGYFVQGDERLFVYKYMPQDVLDVARRVEYFHTLASQS
ncbi:hypothetical protein HID58_028472 [Brassica napus]|uniref:Serine-threonine/tyrosine-protein kinase catalytic domain-containing protein n=2 Tax=Brassica TaxID=3705 RepID=A0A8D9M2Y5_BRACM|nr:hypothetical protein HID58_028472 [Brassica napus]CAF2215416.1 unnamed protein product [Brassica napus]CAG7896632.1 unnamed protein product [Brassica rapa]